MPSEINQPFPQNRRPGATVRDAALVAAVNLEPVLRAGDAHSMARVVGRMPRPVLIAGGLAAAAGIAAVIHFTGGALGAGLGNSLPQAWSQAGRPPR